MIPRVSYKDVVLFQDIDQGDLEQLEQCMTRRCIQGITANEDQCRHYVDCSIGIVTALNPYIGYENSTRIAMKALQTGRGVMDLVQEEGLLSREQLEKILSPSQMCHPQF